MQKYADALPPETEKRPVLAKNRRIRIFSRWRWGNLAKVLVTLPRFQAGTATAERIRQGYCCLVFSCKMLTRGGL